MRIPDEISTGYFRQIGPHVVAVEVLNWSGDPNQGGYQRVAAEMAASLREGTSGSSGSPEAEATPRGGYNRAALDFAANSAEWGWGKWIPFAGVGLDLYAAAHDARRAYGDYGACVAQP
jgi:hypothetical protein